jgi:hypothetical protein
MRRILFTVVACLPLVACGGGSSPTEPGGSSSSVLQGQTVNAIDGAASPNLSVQVGHRWAVISDSSGFFQVEVDPGTYRTIVRGNAIVERDTRLTGPTSNRLRLSLIPASFDLNAFNEMFRGSNARLQRWTSRPALVVLASIMEYESGPNDQYAASGEQLSDDEVSQMLSHLNEGLALLTGNTYTSFSSVEIERSSAGTRVSPLRNGKIVVGRYKGIEDKGNTIGYGQWSEMQDGTIVGGAMFLDRNFDRDDGRRRLLRIHELGHALGYQHVESRTSIMNPAIGPEPTDFDRAGALITFQRPVGNKDPDVDPGAGGGVLGVTTGAGARWSPRTVCR